MKPTAASLALNLTAGPTSAPARPTQKVAKASGTPRGVERGVPGPEMLAGESDGGGRTAHKSELGHEGARPAQTPPSLGSKETPAQRRAGERRAFLEALPVSALEPMLREYRSRISIRAWLRIDAICALVSAAEGRSGAKGEVIGKILEVEEEAERNKEHG